MLPQSLYDIFSTVLSILYSISRSVELICYNCLVGRPHLLETSKGSVQKKTKKKTNGQNQKDLHFLVPSLVNVLKTI